MRSLAVIFGLAAILATILVIAPAAKAEQDPNQIAPSADSVLLMVFLKHPQDKNLEEMGEVLRERKWLSVFPPEGVTIRGWYMMMGVGHLAILEVPPVKIREVNRALESVAYGVFQVEVRPGYDFLPVILALQEKYKNAEGK